jgi:hypothetical protein
VKLYTIVFEFRGGTFISQFSALNEVDALNQWAGSPDDYMLAGVGFAGRKVSWISKVRAQIENEKDCLVRLKGLKSAWCTHVLIGRSGGLINVIMTACDV